MKWVGCEADYTFQPSAKVKNVWDYMCTPPMGIVGNPSMQMYKNCLCVRPAILISPSDQFFADMV